MSHHLSVAVECSLTIEPRDRDLETHTESHMKAYHSWGVFWSCVRGPALE